MYLVVRHEYRNFFALCNVVIWPSNQIYRKITSPEIEYCFRPCRQNRFNLNCFIPSVGIIPCAGKNILRAEPYRIDFLHRYLRCLKKAAADGVDIRGYFQWCFTDNFEWSKGYTERFGIVHCNFETQERIVKDSAYWYQDVIKSNGAQL